MHVALQPPRAGCHLTMPLRFWSGLLHSSVSYDCGTSIVATLLVMSNSSHPIARYGNGTPLSIR